MCRARKIQVSRSAPEVRRRSIRAWPPIRSRASWRRRSGIECSNALRVAVHGTRYGYRDLEDYVEHIEDELRIVTISCSHGHSPPAQLPRKREQNSTGSVLSAVTMTQTDKPTRQKPLRLWPGVVIAILQCLLWFGVPVVVPEATLVGVLAGPIGALAVVLWWVFFSRVPWTERLGAVGLMVAALFATSRLIDKSIATGAMGMLFPMLAIPVLCLAFVVWAVASRCLSDELRRDDGRDHPARLWSVSACPDRWLHRQLP